MRTHPKITAQVLWLVCIKNSSFCLFFVQMLKKYWKLWQECLEEAEDKSFQPLTQMAQKSYRWLKK